MGIELARAFVTVGATTAPAVNAFSTLRSAVDQDLGAIGQSVAGMSAGVGSAMNDIRTSILGVVGAVAVMGDSFLKSGMAAAESFEQTTIAFDTMLGSAQETKDILSKLTDFAAKTPFEMPEILVAARGLIQFGERGTELMETLKILGNAASGTSTDFGMVSLIFNQVRGVGKLLTQDFRQLSTRGVLSLADIAKHFGVTTEAAQTMLSTGKISFGDLRDILKELSDEGGRFAGLMEKQSHSLGGLKSTLNDAVGILKRTIAIPIGEWTKPFIGGMISAVEKMTAFVNLFPDLIGGALYGAVAMSKLATAILSANFAMRLFGVTWKTVLVGTGIGVAIVALGAALGLLLGPIQSLIKYFASLKPVQDAIAIASGELGEAWERIKVAASNIWAAIKPLIDQFLKMIGIDFSGLGTSVGEALGTAITFVSGFVLSVANYAQAITENWQLVWDLLVTGANLAVSSAIDVFDNLYTNAIDIATRTGEGLISAFNVAGVAIIDLFSALGAFIMAELNVIPPLTKAVVNAFVQYFVGGMEMWLNMWDYIPTVASAAFSAILAGGVAFGNVMGKELGVILILFKDTFALIPTIAQAAFMRVMAGLKELAKSLSRLPELIATAVKGGDVAGKLAEIGGDIQGAMDDAWEKSGGSKAIDDLTAEYMKGAGLVAAEAAKVPGIVKDAWDASGGTGAMKGLGEAYVSGVANTAQRIAEQFQRPELVDALQAVGEKGMGVMDSLVGGAQDVGFAFTDAFSGINLKGLTEASGLTQGLADKAYDLFNKFTNLKPSNLPLPLKDDKKKKDEGPPKKDEKKTGEKATETHLGFAEYGKKLQDMLMGKGGPAETSAKEAVKHTELLVDIKDKLSPTSAPGASAEDAKKKLMDQLGGGAAAAEAKKKLMDQLGGGVSPVGAADAKKKLMDQLGNGVPTADETRKRLLDQLGTGTAGVGGFGGLNMPKPDDSVTKKQNDDLLKETTKQTGLLSGVVDQLKQANEKPRQAMALT